MNDSIAISRLKRGDLSGLEALVRRYQARAVHAAYMIVYDRPLAEEGAEEPASTPGAGAGRPGGAEDPGEGVR